MRELLFLISLFWIGIAVVGGATLVTLAGMYLDWRRAQPIEVDDPRVIEFEFPRA